MDLALTDGQVGVRDLAREILEGMCTDERLREIEAGPERLDLKLWTELARAGLLAFGVPEADGGNGGGMIELCLILEEAGRAAAPVPLWAALVTGALPIARFGSDAQRARLLAPYLTGGGPVVAALDEANTLSLDGDRISGTLTLVPAGPFAGDVIVAHDRGLFIVEATEITFTPQHVSGGEPLYAGTIAGARTEQLAGPEGARWLHDAALIGLCALQAGMCDAAVRLTATYTSEREQFERPLATFQAVQQRIADASIEVEVIRWTTLHAAWRLDAGLATTEEAAIAKYFAAAGGARALEAAQHLHGGMGVDMDYPLHRYRLLGHQTELALGGAAAQLSRIGALLAT